MADDTLVTFSGVPSGDETEVRFTNILAQAYAAAAGTRVDGSGITRGQFQRVLDEFIPASASEVRDTHLYDKAGRRIEINGATGNATITYKRSLWRHVFSEAGYSLNVSSEVALAKAAVQSPPCISYTRTRTRRSARITGCRLDCTVVQVGESTASQYEIELEIFNRELILKSNILGRVRAAMYSSREPPLYRDVESALRCWDWRPRNLTHVVPLLRADLRKIAGAWVGVKLDGERRVVVRTADGLVAAASHDTFAVLQQRSSVGTNETLALDCELVHNTTLYAHDCLMRGGAACASQSFGARFAECALDIPESLVRHKRFVRGGGALPTCDEHEPSDGFVIICGDGRGFKWKPRECMTVDVLAADGSHVVEYSLGADARRVRARYDKTGPNSWGAIVGTVRAHDDAITVDELCDALTTITQ